MLVDISNNGNSELANCHFQHVIVLHVECLHNFKGLEGLSQIFLFSCEDSLESFYNEFDNKLTTSNDGVFVIHVGFTKKPNIYTASNRYIFSNQLIKGTFN